MGHSFRACLYCLQSSCLGLPNAGITGTRDHTKHRLYSLAVISTYTGGQKTPEMKHSFALTTLTEGSTWLFLPPWYSMRRAKYFVRFVPRWYRPTGKQFPHAQKLAEPGCGGPSVAQEERAPTGLDPHTKRTGHRSCFRLHEPCQSRRVRGAPCQRRATPDELCPVAPL